MHWIVALQFIEGLTDGGKFRTENCDCFEDLGKFPRPFLQRLDRRQVHSIRNDAVDAQAVGPAQMEGLVKILRHRTDIADARIRMFVAPFAYGKGADSVQEFFAVDGRDMLLQIAIADVRPAADTRSHGHTGGERRVAEESVAADKAHTALIACAGCERCGVGVSEHERSAIGRGDEVPDRMRSDPARQSADPNGDGAVRTRRRPRPYGDGIRTARGTLRSQRKAIIPRRGALKSQGDPGVASRSYCVVRIAGQRARSVPERKAVGDSRSANSRW